MPALAALARAGLCRPQRYLPPWVEDRRFLVTFLSLQRFLADTEIGSVKRHYQELLADVEPLHDFGRS